MLVRVEIYINVRYVIFTYVFAYRNWRSSRNFRPKLPTVLFLLVDPSFRFNPTRASVTNRKFRARHSIGISGCPRGTCLPCSATVSIKITTSELDSRWKERITGEQLGIGYRSISFGRLFSAANFAPEMEKRRAKRLARHRKSFSFYRRHFLLVRRLITGREPVMDYRAIFFYVASSRRRYPCYHFSVETTRFYVHEKNHSGLLFIYFFFFFLLVKAIYNPSLVKSFRAALCNLFVTIIFISISICYTVIGETKFQMDCNERIKRAFFSSLTVEFIFARLRNVINTMFYHWLVT